MLSIPFTYEHIFFNMNNYQNIYCSTTAFGILLNTKTLSIKHAYTTKTVLFLTCKRHYNNDASCYQELTFASNAQWRRPLFFFFRMAASTKLKNKRFYKPMLYQFCIANNAVETRF